MTEEFQRIYEGLNDAQKKAVESVEGPVMVVAGPGTGKTQILAVRILNILIKTDARPQDILCITYTDAGATAMRKRLHEFLGADAYRVNIYTFHGLCSEIIRENEDYFNRSDMQPLSDLERIMVTKEIYDELPNDHKLKNFRPHSPYILNSLSNLFSFMKREGLESKTIKKLSKEAIDELPYREDFVYKRNGNGYKKGDPKTGEINKEKQTLEKLALAAECFDIYIGKLKEINRFDFEDMILWVNKLFDENPEILSEYQERFLYVLADEFQDTSGAQKKVLMHLVSYWDSPNIFVVGDEDQSIYKFQGANIKNIVEYREKFSNNLTEVILNDNYRSSQNILDSAGEFIQKNSERLGQKGNDNEGILKAKGKGVSELNKAPIVTEYYNQYHEIVDVGNRVVDLIKMGVAPEEIAVIYKEHKQSDDLVKYLMHKNIPVNVKKTVNVLEENLIGQILNILEYVSNESEQPFSGEHHLFQLLHYEFFEIDSIEIAKLSYSVSKSRKKWREYLHSLVANEKKDLFSDTEQNSMLRVFRDTEHWIEDSFNLTLPQLVERITNNSGILSFILESQDKQFLLQVLHTFFDFVKEENAKNPTMTIREFLDLISLMRESNVGLNVARIQYSDSGVNLVTAHSSKGLEFEYVFLIGCLRNNWEKKSSRYPFSIDKLYESQNSTGEEGKLEENRRLFYVAMTRAKKELSISYAGAKLDGKAQEKSQFISELEGEGNVESGSITLESDAIVEFQSLLLSNVNVDANDLISGDIADLALVNYALSPTHLNEYLRCPISFYFNKILKVPSAKNEFMAFGSAIHGTLESYFKTRSETGKFPSDQEVEKQYVRELYRNRDAFTQEALSRRLEYGKRLLKEYLVERKELFEKTEIVSLEKHFRNTEVKGIPIKGIIDKLEFDGKNATIVDYKTGRHKNAKMKLRGPKLNKATGELDQGQDYWRQMVFYRILLEEDRSHDWKYKDSYFDFVEPDDNGDYHLEQVPVNEPDIEILEGQIRMAYQGIMKHEFSRGCNDEGCHWCNFVKEHRKKGKVFTKELLSQSVVEE
jgi:DNA helicase-2/ATP-dependent DNA helicase PcrA